MVIRYHDSFVKKSKKLTKKQQEKLTQRLKIFGKDEFDQILNNHALTGAYKGHRSINISGDLRAIYIKESNVVTFVTVDTHSNLYK